MSRTTTSPRRARSTSTALISSWGVDRPRGILETSTISMPSRRPSSTASGASRSTTTTSASARAWKPRRVSSPGSPGPPPTRTTRPPVPGGAVRRGSRRAGPPRAATPPRPSARHRGGQRPGAGSRSPCTLTVARPLRPVAGIHAEAVRASSARRQKVRWASASRRTASLTSGSAVHAIASQQPARSPSAYTRGCQSRCPRSARSCRAGTTAGGDDRDHGAGGQQRPHPAQRDGPSADDDHGPPTQAQAQRQQRLGAVRPGHHASTSARGSQFTTTRMIRAVVRDAGSRAVRPGRGQAGAARSRRPARSGSATVGAAARARGRRG